MKTILHIISLFLMIVVTIPSTGRTTEAGKACFVDLDGDGIHDNAIDNNKDGIPEIFSVVATGSTKGPDEMILDVPGIRGRSLMLSLMQQYQLRQFALRDLNRCRSSLDAEFSAGLGGGISTGSACAGGVCGR